MLVVFLTNVCDDPGSLLEELVMFAANDFVGGLVQPTFDHVPNLHRVP